MALVQSLISGAKALSAFVLSKQILFVIGGLVGVGFIIAWHECGHFLFAKLFGVKVPNFSIGMGPKIFSTQIGDTSFSLSAIPLGGYVEIATYPEEGQPDAPYYFINKPYWQKLCVLSGGILFNLIFAYVAFIAIYRVGMPVNPFTMPDHIQPVVEEVLEGGPAEKAGIKPGDVITWTNGHPVLTNLSKALGTAHNTNMADHIKAFRNSPGQVVEIKVNRGGQELSLTVTLGEKDGKGYAGFAPKVVPLEPMGFGTAIKSGIHRVNSIIGHTFGAIKGMFSRRSLDGLGGPVMIISQTVKSAERGLAIFLIFLGYISIGLAVLNLLPLPILDGGQVVTSTIEAIIRRPLPLVVRNSIALATWALFLALSIFLVFRDIKILRQLRSETKTEQKS